MCHMSMDVFRIGPRDVWRIWTFCGDSQQILPQIVIQVGEAIQIEGC